MSREVHVRFCESGGVRFPSATHLAISHLQHMDVLTFHLDTDWDLIVRPDFAVTYQPSPHEQFG